MAIRLMKSSEYLPSVQMSYSIICCRPKNDTTRVFAYIPPAKGFNPTEAIINIGDDESSETLMDCYRELLSFAALHNLSPVRLPLFPEPTKTKLSRKEILYAACQAYLDLSQLRKITVYLIDDAFTPEEERILSITEFLAREYIAPSEATAQYSITDTSKKRPPQESNVYYSLAEEHDDDIVQSADNQQSFIQYSADYEPPSSPTVQFSREEALWDSKPQRFDPARGFLSIDEGFGETVLRLIQAKGMTESQCYNKANITRAAFHKIRQSAKNPQSTYRPSKQTAMALAVALELNLDEASDLLERAGYAFSHSNKGDIIVEYFLSIKNYNMFELNDVLFHYDQPLLGSVID